MLHPLNPPTCITELQELINWQRKVLIYARDHSSFNRGSYAAAMGADFLAFIAQGKTFSGNSSKPFKDFESALEQLTNCPLTNKQQVVADFEHDQKFYTYLDDPSFQFALRPAKSKAHQLAQKCLVTFYEFLSSGLPQVLVPAHVKSIFRKPDIVEGYKQTNDFVEYVCPCCDSQWTDVPGANREGYTLEHYFHKEEYPSICLHPLNLVPMCTGCNNRRHNKDALNPRGSLPIPYDEVFHPLYRPVRRHAELTYIPSASGREQMQFIALPSERKNWVNAIDGYGIMYQIPDRWHRLWKRVEQRADRTVRACIRLVTRDGRPLDQTVFKTVLDDAIYDLETNYEHFNYAAARWLRWARQHKFQDLYRDYDVS